MIFWRFCSTGKTQIWITWICLGYWLVAINIELAVIAKVLLSINCIVIWLELVRQFSSIPLAISTNTKQWTIIYSNKIEQLQLQSGFVLGPFAYVKFKFSDQTTKSLWIARSDIVPSNCSGCANWTQLKALIIMNVASNSRAVPE